MQELLMKARGQTHRKPPQFQRISMPLKMMTMSRPNDGFHFSFAVPFSQRFQTNFGFDFSNKKAPEFEFMAMLAGGNNMMNEEEMSYINAQSGSNGRLGIQGQYPLPLGVKLSTEMDMQSPDP